MELGYIRTKDNIYEIHSYYYYSTSEDDKTYDVGSRITEDEIVLKYVETKDVIKQGDTIETLCDYLFYKNREGKILIKELPFDYGLASIKSSLLAKQISDVKLAILTDKGLTYVAKMNEEGKIVLLNEEEKIVLLNEKESKIERLVIKNKQGEYYSLVEQQHILNKLGQFEDMQEKYGVDLFSIFEKSRELEQNLGINIIIGLQALQNGIYTKNDGYIHGSCLKLEQYRINVATHSYSLPFKGPVGYGKTWALTQEELS